MGGKGGGYASDHDEIMYGPFLRRPWSFYRWHAVIPAAPASLSPHEDIRNGRKKRKAKKESAGTGTAVHPLFPSSSHLGSSPPSSSYPESSLSFRTLVSSSLPLLHRTEAVQNRQEYWRCSFMSNETNIIAKQKSTMRTAVSATRTATHTQWEGLCECDENNYSYMAGTTPWMVGMWECRRHRHSILYSL